ncbi:hypothetical protein T310_1290 [Rasamsonia emersonii CBS 393.64]|uniref:Uncharacterized protein n=1 Tax=Rasamsonia emersonii (strain ATCC 16479 / CBS 393.64 / IMI 116815) TaxID=1408163 RepID=A0A0F4Z490_RASE3|nr:hypothetical protein T310_1290 [Rasamsonia emersonii CBS 393.64]KKA24683.1 hypothetical protein T310_1290 [Rasamsonia emersonii CBS 393.64]
MSELRICSYTCGHISPNCASPLGQVVQERGVVNAELVQVDHVCPSCEFMSRSFENHDTSPMQPQAGSSDTMGMEDLESQQRASEPRDLYPEFGLDLQEHGQANYPMRLGDNQQQPENFTLFNWKQEEMEINQFLHIDALDADSYLFPEPKPIRTYAEIPGVDDISGGCGYDLSVFDIDELFSEIGQDAHEDNPCAMGDLDSAFLGERPVNESFPSAPAAMSDDCLANSANLSETLPIQPPGLPVSTADTEEVLFEDHGTQPEATSPPQHLAVPAHGSSKGRGRPRKPTRKAAVANLSSIGASEPTNKKRPTPKKARAHAAVKNQDVSTSESAVISGVEALKVTEVPKDDGKDHQKVEENKENQCPNSKREGSPFVAGSDPGPREAKRLCTTPTKTTTETSQVNQTEVQPENPSGSINAGDTTPSKNGDPAQRGAQLRRSSRLKKLSDRFVGDVK